MNPLHLKFQKRVAESGLTLPACFLLTMVIWCFPLMENDTEMITIGAWNFEVNVPRLWVDILPGLALCILTAYLLAETNNTQQIIRIRTRLMSSCWLVMASCFAFLHSDTTALFCALAFSFAVLLVFRSYQLYNPVNLTFQCFLCLGIGSLAWTLMLVVAVVFFFIMKALTQSFSWRCFWAGMVGLMFSYWCWLMWSLWSDNFMPLTSHFTDLRNFQFPGSLPFSEWGTVWVADWLFMIVLALLGIGHFLYTSYNDKLRVRTFFHVYLLLIVILQVTLFVQPRLFPVLMAMSMVCASPFIAHYFALTDNRFSNILFIIVLLSYIPLTLLNMDLI